ncbi:hypothetical protein CSUB01_02191 [Colletotrichum sublineola]|uniref:Uncharacterized protein n=1 Tax=Colletotrichum sublineola TaxID=1173701 RepID=A0A066X4A1_COLSU|nr:hypothetical protein CSUB01_02191 [Colletotrichum sublineola]
MILALVASAAGCSSYLKCRCQQADGSPDNNATTQACADNRSQIQGGDSEESTAFLSTTDANGTTWCNAGNVQKAFYVPDNCDMRVSCIKFNATGTDSWCEEHWN